MHATGEPTPFPAAAGFTVRVEGGLPPYTCEVLSPPSPPGTEVILGPPMRVTVPPGTPSGTVVQLEVKDSSDPPQVAPVDNQVV